MSGPSIVAVRSPADIADAAALVWEFFDFLRGRYPERMQDLDDYIAHQQVSEKLAAFAEHYNPPAGECFLARQGPDAVGIVMVRPRRDGNAELNRMYVRASARGTGTGRALCRRAIESARDLGYPAIWLGALPRHVEALPLYESFGFERMPDPEAPASGDDSVIHMRLALR